MLPLHSELIVAKKCPPVLRLTPCTLCYSSEATSVAHVSTQCSELGNCIHCVNVCLASEELSMLANMIIFPMDCGGTLGLSLELLRMFGTAGRGGGRAAGRPSGAGTGAGTLAWVPTGAETAAGASALPETAARTAADGGEWTTARAP